MKHNYQKVAIGMTIALMGAGAYFGSEGMIIPEEDDYSGAGIGAGLGFAAGLSFYAVTKIGINAIEKCLEWCGSDRGNKIKFLHTENEALKNQLRFFSMPHPEQGLGMQVIQKSSQSYHSLEDGKQGEASPQKTRQALRIQ